MRARDASRGMQAKVSLIVGECGGVVEMVERLFGAVQHHQRIRTVIEPASHQCGQGREQWNVIENRQGLCVASQSRETS